MLSDRVFATEKPIDEGFIDYDDEARGSGVLFGDASARMIR